MDYWEEIPDFPEYLVSDRGLICNARTGRLLRLSRNQTGVVLVGLMRDKHQYKRSVALLVAKAFLPPPPVKRFDAIIHLNGNRDHNFVDNLMWRPRPFAIAYHEQLKQPYINHIDRPIQDAETGELFSNSLKAAMKYGLLERAVVLACLNSGTTVFPTGQTFRIPK